MLWVNMESEEIKGDSKYAFEKFNMAVYLLAIGQGSIKERLSSAYYEIAPVQDQDIPFSMKSDFKWIMHELTKKPSKNIKVIRDGRVVEESLGKLMSTLRFMRKAKAVQIAKKICELEDKLRTETQNSIF